MRPIRAHPRSRGENHCAAVYAPVATGSSPLTRGKLALDSRRRRQLRLIPAHAGKTRFQLTLPGKVSAHPRSRGENELSVRRCQSGEGSSPLTRGKPSVTPTRVGSSGLIPAHAGKTVTAWAGLSSRRAHPRSRGENHLRAILAAQNQGSSPLTRGKRGEGDDDAHTRRLIPAHAGKTTYAKRQLAQVEAHPRSRGENFPCSFRLSAGAGSSPLTRGKLTHARLTRRESGLIPAHAGKTCIAMQRERGDGAHPRSRGENSRIAAATRRSSGSSPLTRGKLVVDG